tara:strand:+ start:15434 stop:15904 length:471 start_codon:yes stop_codon:yes gene_type:complete
MILSPSNSDGRVRINTPPMMARNLFRSLVLPSSTIPRSRANDNVTVARMIHTIIHETPNARLKIDAASYLIPTPSKSSAANAASMITGNPIHQSIMVKRGRTKVQKPKTIENQVRSLGSMPGEANLCRRIESRGMTVRIDKRIEIAHLISSQSKGE